MIIPLVQVPPTDGSAVTAEQVPELRRLHVIGDVHLAGAAHDAHTSYAPLLAQCGCRVGPFGAEDGFLEDDAITDAIVSWLDKGARRAVLHMQQPAASAAALAAWTQQLPDARSRLVLQVQSSNLGSSEAEIAAALPPLIESLSTAVCTMQFDMAESPVTATRLAQLLKPLRGKEGSAAYLELVFCNVDQLTTSLIGQLHKEFGIDVVAPCHVESVPDPSDTATPPPPPDNGSSSSSSSASQDVAAAVFACLRSDRPDGLIPTVVCDECGVALGLVYSNAQSVAASIACGRGVYWSRSRGGLWRKGDTSGAWQALLALSMDCDSDALRFLVVQHGAPPAFCHFNRRACWAGEGGLGALERTLAARRASAPAGSYTARLFSDAALLRNKLVEEAQELAEAQAPDDVASEAADVLYFALVRCAAAGVGLREVGDWLDRRALKLRRRPGNAKAHRIAAGDAILKAQGAEKGGGGEDQAQS
ncbi:hypothetical protein JKP88DRAFT_204084 [Tribonema minus]|uniref:Phosphoribosyl-AMP cyclohydrolase domain-containing protein n=1 Tax=Tribonema minus TaxID=303371 RepID=A0A835ZKL0_9STRA|nr:hypothetical protein JKP88DRAFT_204084 [Tribonema minus]